MLSLNATTRSEFGKKTKKLRKEGMLPGILYGPKIEKAMPLSLKYDDFSQVYKEAGESSLIELRVEDRENVVLIRDAVIHPLTQRFIHSDFYQVPMDEKITITIPITVSGEAPAVKDEGAVLIRNTYDIEVSALPRDLPKEVVADLSSLKHIDDSILVKDLAVSDGVTFEVEEDLVIASVSAPAEEKIIEETPEEVSMEDIKTEAEEKKESAEDETSPEGGEGAGEKKEPGASEG